jgi:uncharacterized protein (TIRG00374 family)
MASSRERDHEDRRVAAGGEVAADPGSRDAALPGFAPPSAGHPDPAPAPHDDNAEPSFFHDPKRLLQTALVVAVLVVAIYFVVPSLAGFDDAIGKLDDGIWYWYVVGLAFAVAMFGSYVALFRGVIGRQVHLRVAESYQITMAGLAATRLLSAGGAGGIVLTYWALRKAGMRRADAAERMVAFLVLLYAIYVIAVIIFGVLLETGVLPGKDPVSVTIIPAAIAGGIALFALAVCLIPVDLQRRLSGLESEGRLGRVAVKLATVPATLSAGIRDAIGYLRTPSQGGLALGGAVGFWAANIGILWASFMAFGEAVPIAVIIQGFFVGMAANLAPAPAGVGAVDGGLIGAFLIFGLPASTVIAAVLIYRLIAFWLPVPPGIVAFLQLRGTVARWEQEGRPAIEDDVGTGDAESASLSNTSESKVAF